MAKRRRQRNEHSGERAPEEREIQDNNDVVLSLKPRHDSTERQLDMPAEAGASEDDSDASSDADERPPKVIRRSLSHIDVCGPAFPRSIYQGWAPPLALTPEAEAVENLQTAFRKQHNQLEEQPEYTYFTLNDFSVYRPDCPRHAHELVTLDRLQNRNGFNEFLFDGILSVGEEQRFVQGVRFRILTIDGYGDPDVISLQDRICIQSAEAAKSDVWYKLAKSSPEYERFYKPFLWLAQFTKHFVDFLLDVDTVTIHHFRTDFFRWLRPKYDRFPSFRSWHYDTVTAHVGYLWKECYSIDDPESGLCKHPIWGEVDPHRLKAIKNQEVVELKTIVTPFSYQCFKQMYFADYLEERHIADDTILNAVNLRKKDLGLTPFGVCEAADASMQTPRSMPDTATDGLSSIREGDVVWMDPVDFDGEWKSRSSTWYAYIQAVRLERPGKELDVLWLYETRDTTLGAAYYPFQKELFLSDNCDCGPIHAVPLSCAKGKVEVAWFVKDPSTESGLFVRQKFRTEHEHDTYDFVTLKMSDFKCHHLSRHESLFEHCRREYETGDTVLVRLYNRELGEETLEPAQLVDFQLDQQQVVLRKLQRATENNPKARPNELLLSNEQFIRKPSRLVRKCHVRSFCAKTVESGLPHPYDRNGAGDFYFTVTQDNHDAEINQAADNVGSEPSNISKHFPALADAWDASAPSPFEKMKGLGIFCGGGNFDRGLEDGGAVEFRYAVDWAERAIYSYRANVTDIKNMQFFLGSVNDYLAKAMACVAPEIAQPGDIELVNAGTPCPGFCLMQQFKGSAESLRNASMVASLTSFVDFYCPKYCILENVVNMTRGMGVNKDENVFAQILATLVALGYQVQQLNMDAWSYSSSASRSRVFIVASAPGLKPLPHPPHTHAHPPYMKPTSSLGKSSNSMSFGVRRHDCTPFQHVSPRDEAGDLPIIGDSQPQLCPAFPDHRTPTDESTHSRARMAAVPRKPPGMGLVQAALQGRLTGEPFNFYDGLNPVRKQGNSKTYSRVYPDYLFPTMTRKLHIQCGRTGGTLHWNEDRSITVTEARRALGFPDNEVIVGNPGQQMEIIGNSVDRKVAFALGLSLRESWTSHNLKADTALPTESSLHEVSSASESNETEAWTEEQSHDHEMTLSHKEKKQNLASSRPFRLIQRILEARTSDIGKAGESRPGSRSPEPAPEQVEGRDVIADRETEAGHGPGKDVVGTSDPQKPLLRAERRGYVVIHVKSLVRLSGL